MKENHSMPDWTGLEEAMASLARKWKADDNEAGPHDLTEAVDRLREALAAGAAITDDRLEVLAGLLEHLLEQVQKKDILAIADLAEERLCTWIREQREEEKADGKP